MPCRSCPPSARWRMALATRRDQCSLVVQSTPKLTPAATPPCAAVRVISDIFATDASPRVPLVSAHRVHERHLLLVLAAGPVARADQARLGQTAAHDRVRGPRVSRVQG